jgi:hypothetical protein
MGVHVEENRKVAKNYGKLLLRTAIKSATFQSVLTLTSAVCALDHQPHNWEKTETCEIVPGSV